MNQCLFRRLKALNYHNSHNSFLWPEYFIDFDFVKDGFIVRLQHPSCVYITAQRQYTHCSSKDAYTSKIPCYLTLVYFGAKADWAVWIQTIKVRTEQYTKEINYLHLTIGFFETFFHKGAIKFYIIMNACINTKLTNVILIIGNGLSLYNNQHILDIIFITITKVQYKRLLNFC